MAVYILTVALYVGFLFVPELFGLDRSDDHYNDNTCSTFIHEKVIATVGFAWAFLGFGLGSLGLSFGFAYVDANKKSRHDKSDVDSQTTYTTLEEGRLESTEEADETTSSGIE